MLEPSYYIITEETAPLCGASEEMTVCRIPYKPVIVGKSERQWDAFLSLEECFDMGIWKWSSNIHCNWEYVEDNRGLQVPLATMYRLTDL
jgi:hypothetical protein